MGRLVLPGSSPFYIQDLFDFIGDSRSAAINSGATIASKCSNHWFPWATALSQQRYRLGLSLGIPGKRTDEYINANFAQMLSSKAAWAVFDMGCVNDLSALPSGGFPFTNQNGVVVTSANVGTVAASNVIAAAQQALAIGKKVILTCEPGATGLTQAILGQMYEYNTRLRAFAEATPNVYIWQPGPYVWNPVSSASAVAFKSGYSSDGTHYTTLGAYAIAQGFIAYFDSVLPKTNLKIGNINNVNATNPRQLINNPLFNTLTGGTCSTMTLSSGTVPSGWNVTGAAGSSVAITSASEPNGYGNAVTFAVTTTGADTVTIRSNQPATSLWNLTDILETGIDVSVAAGSSKASVFAHLPVSTDNGTIDCYDLYPPSGMGDGPTTAYSLRFRTLPNSPKAGAATKSFIEARTRIQFSAAGSCTVTLSLADLSRRMSYSNGAFTG